MACPFSVQLRNPRNGKIYFRPCGSCMSCRIAHRTDWEFRIYTEVMLEHSKGNESTFATLTYSDDFLPRTSKGEPTISKEDVDQFYHRFDYTSKKKLGRKFKQFFVTEYGDSFGRPHAHSIVIGLSPDYRNLLAFSWLRGHVMCLPVLSGGIRYVLKYMDKQIFGSDNIKTLYGDRVPPFSKKSHGIGLDYIKSHYQELLENDGYVFHGKKFPLSPYMISYLQNYDTSLLDDRSYFDKKIKNLADSHGLSYLDEKNYQSALHEISIMKNSLMSDGLFDPDRLSSLESFSNQILTRRNYGYKTIQMAEDALGV